MTTAAKLIEEIRVIVKGDGTRDSASPAALHVGERAHWLLSNAPALFGVPIVPTSDLGTAYQLLNGSDAVILEGELDEP